MHETLHAEEKKQGTVSLKLLYTSVCKFCNKTDYSKKERLRAGLSSIRE